jgi:hypothetical protein
MGFIIEPLKPNGSLDRFERFNLTPEIGTEFVNTSLAEILRADDAEDLLHDLALLSKSLLQATSTSRNGLTSRHSSINTRSCLFPNSERPDRRAPQGGYPKIGPCWRKAQGKRPLCERNHQAMVSRRGSRTIDSRSGSSQGHVSCRYRGGS